MSVLCDIFVASVPDAMVYHELLLADDDSLTPPRFNVKSYGGLTPETFTNLSKIVCDGGTSSGLKHIAHEENGQWWLEEFELSFVEALRNLSKSDIEIVSLNWSDIDESIESEESAKQILADLNQLARITSSEKKGLYLWGSV